LASCSHKYINIEELDQTGKGERYASTGTGRLIQSKNLDPMRAEGARDAVLAVATTRPEIPKAGRHPIV
jgi:hypothetical protein